VRDTATLLNAVAGAAIGDPYAPPHAPLAVHSPLRVGVMTETPRRQHPVHTACTTAADITAHMLEELDHAVEVAHPAALDDEGFAAHAAKIMPFAFAAFALSWWERRTGIALGPDDVEPWTWTCAELGRAISAPEYLTAVEYIQDWTRRLHRWHEDYDILLTPTLPEPPPPLGSFDPDSANPFHVGTRSAQIVAFTYPFNLSGQPAISLPVHVDGGLPIGVQLVAAHGHEDLLLMVAAQLEEAFRWRERPLPLTDR